jgi:hypothetical protein
VFASDLLFRTFADRVRCIVKAKEEQAVTRVELGMYDWKSFFDLILNISGTSDVHRRIFRSIPVANLEKSWHL